MEIKLFGRSLFGFKKEDHFYNQGINQVRKSEFLPDFQNTDSNEFLQDLQSISDATPTNSFSTSTSTTTPVSKRTKKVKPEPIVKTKTPKEIHEMKFLHDLSFKFNTDPAYVDSQLEDFKTKLSMISGEEYDMRRGVEEIGAIVTRLENRKKYPEFAEFYSEYPYTTRAKVTDLIKEHTNLQLGKIAQFLADMPQEATKAMKEYTAQTVKLCGLKPVFYIIADKKDFKKTEKRRDPILLAQSPFGVAWQILGAWDEEMLLVDEL